MSVSANSSIDSSHSPGDSLSRSYSMSTADRLRESVPTPRDYDGLKSQCDKAMHELQILRRHRIKPRIGETGDTGASDTGGQPYTHRGMEQQHSETVRRCEHTMKELEYYRGESLKQTIEPPELRFTSDINDLRPPPSQDGEGSSGEAMNQLYLSTVSKYEAVKDDYETLRKRYDDLITSHSTAVDKLELAQEEVGRLKKQCEEMVGERNVAVRERNGLKQQCTAAIRQWDIALREKNEYQEALLKVQQQHEEAVKEINQAMAVRMKASKDLKRLTDERNAAMHEYSLIMSERDTVHKEMEKLSEDLTQAFKKNKAFEAENKQLADEKKALSYQVETLKREIASALHDRDKALKECTDLRGKEKDDAQRDTLKRFSDYKYRERDSGSKELGESNSSSMDLYDKCQKEKVDDIDQANQEIDRLLKHNDKLQAELQESLQEAEVCKRRRDWAFSERDKIVQERESIRTLCDRLRRERDRAVSDLAEALRDSDDIKKQRNETSKQLKVLKERMEAQLEKESRMVQLQSSTLTHNYSHDSAIDTDMHEWDTETLTIQLAGPETEDLGLELAGGREDPHLHNDSGVYVTSVSRGSIGYGKLKPNDCIMRINNVDCTNVSKRYVLETLRSCGSTLILVVRRRRISTTQLQLNSFEHGLNLESGIYISKIFANSLAAREGNLSVGDRVLTINSRLLEGMTAKEAQSLLNESGDTVLLSTVRCSGVSQSAAGASASYSVRQANASTQTLVPDTPPPAPSAPVYRPSPVVNLPSESSVSGSAWSRQRQILAEEKKRNRNSSPLTFEQERDDAIAELDSVIDSYHQRTATVRKRTKDKNNGTWPKARGVAVVENGTGTIVERKGKERLPLTALLTSPNYSLPRCCDGAVQPRHSNPLPLDFTVKQGGLEYYVEKKKGEERHSHIHSQLYGSPHGYPFTPFGHRHSHTHSPPPHLTIPDTRFCFEPPYSTLSQYHHTHSPSVDSAHYHKARSHPHHEDPDHPVYHYETGTFPRKRENQRFRVPSNPSVTSKGSGGKMSTSSIEKSERGSPMPQFHVEVLSPGHRQPKASSLPDYCWPHKPLPGELRRVHIDKSCEPLGIQISCLESGGVFVSTVSDHSLAAQVGLQVGDQLLEVCGINMRSATYKLAANVLRQCGNSITMLVQYSPDKYHEVEGSGSSSGGSKSRSGSPTPCNSPRPGSPALPHHATQLAKAISSLVQHRRSSTPRCSEEPRCLSIETHKCSNLGISLVGGNKVGIFIHSVQNNSLAYNAGLRTGDRILEYNGTDLRQATAEEAAYELAKPADKVTVLVQFSVERYQDVRDKPGDSLYMRALFDRLGEQGDALQLRFRKDDILYVDNTMFNGVPGAWRAWLLDDDGVKHTCGIIPSKYKVEEEMVVRRSLGDLEGDGGRRGTRRSFFRRKKHQRTDSKELASFSNMTALTWYSDSGSLHDDTVLASYQRVTRLHNPVLRPVLVVGPLSELVTEKLLQDFPDKFVKCVPEMMHCSQATMEKGISDNLFVDYRKKGTYFEVTSVSTVRDMSDKNAHCVLDVGLASVERLLRHQIYPIVLLIKFKSTKQIKEIKDTRYALDKVTAKAAKEMYEHALKLESEYRHYISAIIPAGVNIAYMCTQVKAAVDLEQNKTLWVPYQ